MDALDAGVAVAREHGLPTDDPRVIRDLTNVLVHLAPAPVVARVSLTLARYWPRERFAQHVELVSFLAEAGAPVAAPARDVDPGPHEHDGLPSASGPTTTTIAHASIRRRWDERSASSTQRSRSTPESCRRVTASTTSSRCSGRSRRPRTPPPRSSTGPLWTDFEGACSGPIEYDLACLTYRGAPGTDEALTAYGVHDPDVLTRVAPHLALFLATMTTAMAQQGRVAKSPEPRVRVERALAYAREM